MCMSHISFKMYSSIILKGNIFYSNNILFVIIISDLRDIPSNAAEADTLGSPEGIVVDLPEGADVTMVQAYFDGEESGVGGQYTGLEILSGKLIIKTENTDAGKYMKRDIYFFILCTHDDSW